MDDLPHSSKAPAFRVLVIDDNQDAADSLYLLLRMWGFEAGVAYDGERGLATARAQHPDCVISDISMPRMSGYEVGRRMREDKSTRGATLIALTAYPDKDRAKAAGFDYHLAKPAAPDILQVILLTERRSVGSRQMYDD